MNWMKLKWMIGGLGVVVLLVAVVFVKGLRGDAPEFAVSSSVNFISTRLQSPLVLEGNTGYSLMFVKADMEAARPDIAWRYLEVFKHNKRIFKLDAQEFEPWGYEFAWFDRYEFDGNSYFVIGDWCGSATCGGELVSLIIGESGARYGNETVNWPVNRSRGYSVKDGELYIYFFDEPGHPEYEAPVFFRFDKLSGNLIWQNTTISE